MTTPVDPIPPDPPQWSADDLTRAAQRGDFARIEAARAAGQLAHLLNHGTPDTNPDLTQRRRKAAARLQQMDPDRVYDLFQSGELAFMLTTDTDPNTN